MSLTAELLRGIAEAIQAEAIGDSWAIYQDAADALQDLADHVAETGRG